MSQTPEEIQADIERQLEHHVTGRYSAFHRHAIG